VVIVPIYRGEEQLAQISEVANDLAAKLKASGVSVKYDDRDTYKPGWKFAQYELQGVPVRIAIGPKDLEKGSLEVARRDTLSKEIVMHTEVVDRVKNLMIEIQENLFGKARNFRDQNITEVNTFEEFKEVLNSKGGFVSAHWDGTSETELKIKDKTKATIRCIPLEGKKEDGKCVLTGNPSAQRVLFAKAY
jgi:prolyl-tRNA synthetase